MKRVVADREFLARADEKAKHWADLDAKGTLTDEGRKDRKQIVQVRATIRPQWLSWPEQRTDADHDRDAREIAERTRPQVLAAFDNQLPFLVERRIGHGRVLFVASGMLSSWNTLPKTNAMLLMDRVLRGMLQRTLPTRNFSSVEQIVLPVADRNALYSVSRPGTSTAEPVSVDALGGDVYGVTLRNVFQRGIYKVTAVKGDGSADPARLPSKVWEAIVAANGPSRESEPAVLDEAGLRERLGDDVHFRWVARGDSISLAGANVSGQDMWKWLLGLVLAGLLVELAILARPMIGRGGSA